MSFLKSIFKEEPNKAYSIPGVQRTPYTYKKKFLMVGTVGAGKSSVIAALYLTAETLSSIVKGFYCSVVENNSDIRNDVSRLRQGHYPKKTEFKRYPLETGLVITWKSPFGDKRIQIPISDVSGEAYYQAIKAEKGVFNQNSVFADENVLNYLDDVDGLMPVIAASRALMFQDNAMLEEVPNSVTDPYISMDDDVNLSRLISAFKLRRANAHKSIEAIGLIVHKWDLIAPYAVKAGMNIYDPSGVGFKNFMDNCYPQTSMELKELADAGKVMVFPSFIENLRNPDGSIITWDKDGKERRVATTMDENPYGGRRIPKYSEQTYFEIFNWIRKYAG